MAVKILRKFYRCGGISRKKAVYRDLTEKIPLGAYIGTFFLYIYKYLKKKRKIKKRAFFHRPNSANFGRQQHTNTSTTPKFREKRHPPNKYFAARIFIQCPFFAKNASRINIVIQLLDPSKYLRQTKTPGTA